MIASQIAHFFARHGFAVLVALTLAACGGGGGDDGGASGSGPAISVVKLRTDTANPVLAGTVLQYSVTVSNSGDVELNNVAISDPLITPGGASCATLAVGASCQLNGSYIVTTADEAAGEVQNIATGNSDETASVESNTVIVSVGANPALSIANALTDQSSPMVVEGSTLEFTATAENTGDIALANVVVTNPLTTPGSVTCSSVAVGATCVLVGDYTVTAADAAAGQVQSTATVDSDETALQSSNTVNVNLSFNPALSITKALTSQSANPAVAGTVLSYTATATNTGNTTLTNLVVSDPLTTPTSQACAAVAVGATCQLAGSYTVTTADVAAGQVQNTAGADSDQTGSASSNTVTVPVGLGGGGNPAMSVTKARTDSNDPVVEGTVLAYSVTATNTGDVPLSNVTVADPLIAPGSSSCASVAVGNACVLSGSYTVTRSDALMGSVQNTASADSSETATQNSNAVVVNVDASPAISVTKARTDSNSPVEEGTVLDYTVSVLNSGNVTLSNVTVTDPLITPDSTACGTLAVGASCQLIGSYTVTAADETAGEVQNTASGDSDETPAQNSNTVTVAVDGGDNPAISVTKARTDSNSPVEEGTVLEYTVQVLNSGNVTLNNVTVNDPLIAPASNSCTTLAVGASCQLVGTYTVTAADEAAGEVQNTASGDSSETPAQNSNTVTVAVDDGSSSALGLDARPANFSCIAPAAPDNGGNYALERVFGNIGPLSSPLWMGQPPEDDTRWFVAEQGGRILSFENTPDVSASTTVLTLNIDDADGERGLLGFAFAPDFATSGEAYVSYTRLDPRPGVFLQSVISRFTSADGGLTLNPASEEIILLIDHFAGNHNGGGIAFGPDGYLYLGMGDGGGSGDPEDNGQDPTNLLGTFIRIDVSGGGTGYTIPPDNPFAGNPACTNGFGSAPCPEIFAWGLRNPFRWVFDSFTGDLYAGDVGNALREEVSLIQRGGNYGWSTKEGFVCRDPRNNNATLPSCDDVGLIDPIIDYPTGSPPDGLGRSVIAGPVYRGNQLSALRGKLVFGDVSSGNIWTIADDGNGNVSLEDIVPSTGLRIVHYAEGADGEIYAVNIIGNLHRLIENTSSGTNTIPDLLSDTGCVDATDATLPASGLIPYVPGAPFWSDDAAKHRWLAIPDGTTVSVDGSGDFIFPQGSILVKNFERGGELIETRLFMRHTGANDVWAGYTYRWNDTQTDAERVVGGAILEAGGSDWIYPSEQACLECHTAAAGRSLGLEIGQLNNNLLYPATGRTANQLATLDGVDVIAPVGDPAGLDAFPDPFGSAPLEQRARAYLHTNCSGCHRPGTPLQTTMDLRFNTPLANTNTCNADSISGGDLGVSGAKLIVPGSSSLSLIPLRMNRRDANAMPPIGSLIADDDGVALINAWIDSLSGC